MDFFSACKSQEEVKTLYRKLSRHFHPDKGGDAELMKEMNRQYTEFNLHGIVFERKETPIPQYYKQECECHIVINQYKANSNAQAFIIRQKDEMIVDLKKRLNSADVKNKKMTFGQRFMFAIFGDIYLEDV